MFRWIELIAAASVMAFVIGYYEGRVSTRKVINLAQMAQMEAADLASTKETERLAAEAKITELAQQLEDAANAQVSNTVCLPADRVLRLNKR